MNILPKKRWHVRTKENIARVRKDEAEAAEQAKQEEIRIRQADRESRLSVLKDKSKAKLLESGIKEPESTIDTAVPSQHINLFANLEDAIQTTNKEHDKELKDKKEDYEKKIGYLTYLGQDTNEALGKKNWYEVAPSVLQSSSTTCIKDTYDKLVLRDEDGKPKVKKSDEKDGEVSWKRKQELDPINTFKHLHESHKIRKSSVPIDPQNKKYFSTNKKNNHKKRKHHRDTDEKKLKLQKLREERLRREQQEKCRTEMFLTGLNKNKVTKTDDTITTKLKPKYNSQFNPELARQNYR